MIRIALTQSEGRLEGLDHALEQRGFEVVRNPLVRTETLNNRELRQRALRLLECPWLLFTSSAAVEAWHELVLPFNKRSQGEALIGAVGQKTAQSLKRFGAQVEFIAEPQHAEQLAQAFLGNPAAAAPVGLPRGDRALPTLQQILEQNKFATRAVIVYKTVTLAWQEKPVDIIVLSSPSAIEALPSEVAAQSKLVAIGPSTGAAIAERGWSFTQATSPEIDAMIEAIERCVAL